jgi:hypothetical protein
MRRIPDKTAMKTELEQAMQRYRGPITKCPPGTANAPGVRLKELDAALQRKERQRARARDAEAVQSLRILQSPKWPTRS